MIHQHGRRSSPSSSPSSKLLPPYFRRHLMVVLVGSLILSLILSTTFVFSSINSDNQRSIDNNHRYLQGMVNNTTKITTTVIDDDDEDDDVSADTILISFSILNTILFVLPTTIRYVFQKRQCLRNPDNVNSNFGCICSEAQLQQWINKSNSIPNTFNDTSVLILCPAITIPLQQPLNITNKKFLLTCGTSRFVNTSPCTITTVSRNDDFGNSNHIIGSPNNVTINDITFVRGNASRSNNGNGNGGSIHMTGGYLTLQNVVFDSNQASGYGGAIYVNNNNNNNKNTKATIKILSRTTFRNNDARSVNAIYNDIYVVPAKRSVLFLNTTTTTTIDTTTPNVYIDCTPTTSLKRPQFCMYDRINSIVIENVTSEKSKFTNCDSTNLIDTQC